MIDEHLTPDSPRYWPLEEYAPGKAQQPSFDKQYVRDVKAGFRKGLESGPVGKKDRDDLLMRKLRKGQGRYAESVSRSAD